MTVVGRPSWGVRGRAVRGVRGRAIDGKRRCALALRRSVRGAIAVSDRSNVALRGLCCDFGQNSSEPRCGHARCHRSRATHGAIDRGSRTLTLSSPLLLLVVVVIRYTRPHRSRATHGAIDRGPRADTASRVAHSDVLRLQPDLESSQTSASTIRNEGRNTDFDPISRQTSRAATFTALVVGETQTCRTKSG